MWKLTKQYWKNMWSALWSKTTIDEKAIATAEEVNDVGGALKEVGNQVGDIADAVKGKSRKGRKRAKNK